MATFKYIVLANSNASLVRRFKATALQRPKMRTDSVNRTVGGSTDKAAGTIIQRFSYILRVPQDDPADANYGNMAELDTLFDLNSPNATPNDQITLTDHYGNNHTVIFVGQMSPEPLTTMLEGDAAYHMVQVDFEKVI